MWNDDLVVFVFNAKVTLKCTSEQIIDVDIDQELALVNNEGEYLQNDANNEHLVEHQNSSMAIS